MVGTTTKSPLHQGKVGITVVPKGQSQLLGTLELKILFE